MAEADACARRVERLRSLMAERGYDAAVLRNNCLLYTSDAADD